MYLFHTITIILLHCYHYLLSIQKYTYYGTKPVEVLSIDTITVSGTATAVVNGNIVRLHSFNSGSAKN